VRNCWGHDGAVKLELSEDQFNQKVIDPLKDLLAHIRDKNMGPQHGDFAGAVAAIDAFVKSPLCIVDQKDQDQLRKEMDELTEDARSFLQQKEAAIQELLEEQEKKKEILDDLSRTSSQTDELRSESGRLQAEIEEMRGELCTLSNDADQFEARARVAEDIQQWFISSLANQTAEIREAVVASSEDLKKHMSAHSAHLASEFGKVSHTLGGMAASQQEMAASHQEIAASQQELLKVVAGAAEKEKAKAKAKAKQDQLLDLERQRRIHEVELDISKKREEAARVPSGDRCAPSHTRPPTAPARAQRTPVASDVDQPTSAASPPLGDQRSDADGAQHATAPPAEAANGDRASESLCKWEQGEFVDPARLSTNLELWS
jgi:hypothetical protein